MSDLAMLIAHKGALGQYINGLRDGTFRGMYRWNAFDTMMLIPYFIVMVILAFYGIHRYQLVWLYYRNPQERGEVA